ncbi:diguanylate cyclase domain-containing protein [Niveispirillum sp. KHB5.9]|uniref:diguanylate cyclase domain-containing protein n=1 Tax=Niveispirillum sp. KHB5.9 TaxID=3400269 RepID=UPI003A8392FE
MTTGFPFVPAPVQARILIVDDDVATIRVLAQVVQSQGDVVFATGGADALAAARAERPDLVLLDAEMEGMDGFQTCAALRTLPGMGDVPILFVTSHRGVEAEVRALAAGAVDFITKPFHPHIVEARVRTHLTLKQRTDALLRMATLDGLTGIANRRALDTGLAHELRRLTQPGASPLSLVLADVDHFKRYNDFYGHQAGDDCLRAVAGALAGSVRRAGDLAARFGGEEFAILLPGADADAARTVAEKLRRTVVSLALPHAARPDADLVTISAGAATLPPSPGGDVDALLVSLVAAADQALYRAKADGRNRVAVAGRDAG